MRKKVCSFLAGLLAVATLALPAQGSVLNIANIAGGTITSSSLDITFQPPAPSANCSVGGGNSGIFVAAAGNCTMQDFQNSTTVNEAGFLSLVGMPGLTLNLTGADAASSPTLGPILNLVQITPNLVSAYATLHGSGTLGSTVLSFDAVLSTQVVGTVAGVQEKGLGPTSWSLTLETTAERQDVPEVQTGVLAGFGVLMIVLGRLRNRNQA